MRLSILAFATLVALTSAIAEPVSGGPCVDGTLADYVALSLQGCTANVGAYALDVVVDGWGSGTNTPGAPYPADASGILIQPDFLIIPGGFQESFAVSFVPGPWTGTPGQSLVFYVSFFTSIDHSFSTVSDHVASTQPGITAEICQTSFGYTFGVFCAGQAYSATSSGTTANVSTTGGPFTSFGVQPYFSGILPNGTFGGFTTTADVVATPEPESGVFLSTMAVLLTGVTLRRIRKRAA